MNGIIFNIDEDAYEMLQKYLGEISSRFSNAEEGKEIISDIEARISELFSQKVNASKQVITIEDVLDVISVMGSPSDFGGNENTQKEEKQKEEKTSFRDKRIYRDPESRILGGVCSGLGAYFNIDPVFIRIFMVITFFAFGPLLYIILWVAIPKAKTTAQKLEMKGEKVNISNIEKSIREEFEDVKQNFKKMKNSQAYKNSESFAERLGHFFVVVITAIGKLFIAFIGIIFIIVGVALLLAFLATFVFGISDISIGDSALSANQFMSMFLDSDDTFLAFLAVFLLIAIPLFSVIYAGVKLIFRIKTRNRVVGWSLTAVWFVCLIYLAVFGINVGKNYKVSDNTINKTILREKTDSLFIKTSITEFSERKSFYFEKHLHELEMDLEHEPDMDIQMLDGVPRITGVPNISIEKCDSNYIEVVVRKKARGRNNKQAKENAFEIEYSWTKSASDTNKTILVFDPRFMIKKDGKWRAPNVDVIIKVPAGKIVVLDKSLRSLLYDVQNTSDMPDWDMAGKSWCMKQEGLTLIN